jgi:hypothetical protein
MVEFIVQKVSFYILESEIGNKKNNKRFIIADKMYYYTTVGEEESIKHYAFHDFKKPRFTINDLHK